MKIIGVISYNCVDNYILPSVGYKRQETIIDLCYKTFNFSQIVSYFSKNQNIFYIINPRSMIISSCLSCSFHQIITKFYAVFLVSLYIIGIRERGENIE